MNEETQVQISLTARLENAVGTVQRVTLVMPVFKDYVVDQEKMVRKVSRVLREHPVMRDYLDFR